MNVLKVENISKSFGDLKAVDQVSFEIGEGVSFGLLGPNGAGKTAYHQDGFIDIALG